MDRIERSITIDAPLERVWDLVTEPGWWVPDDATRGDRSPGAVTVREYDGNKYPVQVVESNPMSYAAFRWASTFPNAELRDGLTTLIEFSLETSANGVLVTVVESGFASLDAGEDVRMKGFESNSHGWEQELGVLQKLAETA